MAGDMLLIKLTNVPDPDQVDPLIKRSHTVDANSNLQFSNYCSGSLLFYQRSKKCQKKYNNYKSLCFTASLRANSFRGH